MELSPTLLFDYPTIDALGSHLVTLVSASGASSDGDASDVLTRQPLALGGDGQSRDVAVVGMSCRFPGGLEGPAMFWDAIQAGRVMTGKVPFERWDVDAITASDKSLSSNVKSSMSYGGFVDDLDMFDASAFKISPAEAAAMDPQQRLLLEQGYHVLHDGRADRGPAAGAASLIGVYVGIEIQDFAQVLVDGPPSVYLATGSSLSVASGRLSFALGLNLSLIHI